MKLICVRAGDEYGSGYYQNLGIVKTMPEAIKRIIDERCVIEDTEVYDDYIEDYVTIKKKLGSNWEERLMNCSEEEINKLFGEERFIFEEFTIK